MSLEKSQIGTCFAPPLCFGRKHWFMQGGHLTHPGRSPRRASWALGLCATISGCSGKFALRFNSSKTFNANGATGRIESGGYREMLVLKVKLLASQSKAHHKQVAQQVIPRRN